MPADPHILQAFVLDGAGGGRAVDGPATKRWSGADGPLWVVLDRTQEQTPAWLREVMGLPELTRESLLAEDTRPRSVIWAEGMLTILRGVNVNPGAEPDDMVTVRVWVDKDRVICLRGRRLFALEDVRSRLDRGHGAKTPGGILVQLTDALTDRMRDVVNNQEEMVDDVEEAVGTMSGVDLRAKLAVPRRQAMTLRRYLSPQRDAIARLSTEPSDLLDSADRMRLREVADELTRLVEELDLLRERSTLIQEQIAAYAAEQMNRTMYILSLVAAIFLPLGFLTGLLGINVGGIPGTQDPLAFWVVCGLLLLLAVVQWWVFKRHRLL